MQTHHRGSRLGSLILYLTAVVTIGFVTALATSTEPVRAANSATSAASTDTSWRQLNLRVPTPGALSQGAATYDEARGEVVLFGGVRYKGAYEMGNPNVVLSETWTWDGSDWNMKNPATSPSARYGARSVFAPPMGKSILFGGSDANGNPLNDTWTWDGTTWVNLNPTTSPPPRVGFSLAYDANNNTVVLFGGLGRDPVFGFGIPLGDTWVFDGTNWKEMTPLLSPAPRYAPALTYDSARKQVVLFGGCTESFTCTGGKKVRRRAHRRGPTRV
ncbi:MAG: hypothetical protein LC753_08785 [Acidobacteria bacterium]|nr:hypothetical protein [Acidobacteriota bacterium]